MNDLYSKSSVSQLLRHLAWMLQGLIINCDVTCWRPIGAREKDPTRWVAGALLLALNGNGDFATEGSQKLFVLSGLSCTAEYCLLTVLFVVLFSST